MIICDDQAMAMIVRLRPNYMIFVIVNIKGATNMLQQILEPGQKAGKKEEEEKVGFWKKFTFLPGFGIMLAIGVVLIGQVSGNQIRQTGSDLQKT